MKMKINKRLTTKIVGFLAVLVFAFVAPLQFASQDVYADQFDDKIRALQEDIAKYQAESEKLKKQAITLEAELAELANQKAVVQKQIEINQTKYDKLVKQIKQTEEDIKNNRDALGETIADLYVDEQISPLEMLASSQTIGDFLDRQEYRNSVRDELVATIDEIKSLQDQLKKQKESVKKVLEQQKKARDTLKEKEAQQQYLLSQTNGEEAAYQNLISGKQQEIEQARALQAALLSRGSQTGGWRLIEGGLNYSYVTDQNYGTWTQSNCPMLGPLSTGGVSYSSPPYNGEDGRGYGCRQCASYVAWKINQTKGYWPSWGDATNFGSHGSATTPQAGTVAVIYGNPGHVAWVETDPYISPTGPLAGKSVILVSQYNFDYGQGYGMYSVMEVSINFFDTYRQL